MFFSNYILIMLWSGLTIAWEIGQRVHTTSGPVLGHKSARRENVSEYLGIHTRLETPIRTKYYVLGIRYAVAPTGKLRFMPPKRFSGDALIHADAFVSNLNLRIREI
jgi:hypothetical protein